MPPPPFFFYLLRGSLKPLLLAPAGDRIRGDKDAGPILHSRPFTGRAVPAARDLRCQTAPTFPKNSQSPSTDSLGGGPRHPTAPQHWGEHPAAVPATCRTRSHARTPALPLGPAPLLLFLVPLVLWLSPGAPQTLPLCLNAHRVLPCPRLQEKKREVNLASCRHRGAARAPRAAARAKAHCWEKKKPETKSREGCRPSVSDGRGSSRRTGIGELQLLGCEDRKGNREPAAKAGGSAGRASRRAAIRKPLQLNNSSARGVTC